MIYRIANEDVKKNCVQEIQSMPLNAYQVKIEKIKRSNPQNALYWKWVNIISNEIGYTADELHEAFKGKFIGMANGKDMFGNLFIKPKSSAELKKEQFTHYMDKVFAFAASQDIRLPTPEHYGAEHD